MLKWPKTVIDEQKEEECYRYKERAIWKFRTEVRHKILTKHVPNQNFDVLTSEFLLKSG